MEKSVPSKPVPGGKSAADSKKTRITYVIDNPFCQIHWPTIDSKSDQDLILELLCSLLSPIGDHRRLHITPTTSKGKRAKKTARAVRKLVGHRGEKYDEPSDKIEMDVEVEGSTKIEPPIAPATSIQKDRQQQHSAPPPPEISKNVLIGLNSITTALTNLASSRLSPTFFANLALQPPKKRKRRGKPPLNPTTDTPPQPYLTTIFLTRSDSQPTPLHAHLPMLTYLSSLPTHAYPTLLVPLPKGAAAKLENALGLPNANFIGLWSTLQETGTTGTLLELVRSVVQPVKVPWLEGKLGAGGNGGDEEERREICGEGPQGLKEGEYQPMRVKRLRSVVGVRKKGGRGQKKAEEG
ncbi:hypothetical protein L211DRAFT_839122 [Terfezia boudieri ATCC MYA-4762]|uniref:Uncharacterized protein n=1 Tax=Terfezia boudieri ATCC MYA-4762 TaxID=1051890 RepID=A0A3N4LJX4_9PEZI|nr:hypothetical protein L211DRAFT_839122 [Terfezia boudieri ATCC MYA-4762]